MVSYYSIIVSVKDDPRSMGHQFCSYLLKDLLLRDFFSTLSRIVTLNENPTFFIEFIRNPRIAKSICFSYNRFKDIALAGRCCPLKRQQSPASLQNHHNYSIYKLFCVINSLYLKYKILSNYLYLSLVNQ